MKQVFAVAPYKHGINFKMQVYDAWVKMGGKTLPAYYPWRAFHKFAYNYELPTFHKSEKIAQLRFVEPVSLSFDTFPDYARYEIIPLIWDCWPKFFKKTCQWFEKHDVRTAIFTSSQTADRMKEQFPQMNILTITEGINTSNFKKGKDLESRKHNIMRLGGASRNIIIKQYPELFYKYCDISTEGFLPKDEFEDLMQDSKVVYIFPQCDTNPTLAGNIETLTQRYWECMLSRMLMIGRAPAELISLIGYNPTIQFDPNNPTTQLEGFFRNIESYQCLVDKNRDVALKYAPWDIRVREIHKWLKSIGYSI